MQMKNSPITAHANEFDSVVQNKSNRAIIPISKKKKSAIFRALPGGLQIPWQMRGKYGLSSFYT